MKVKCRICEKEFKQITNTHLKRHDMNVDQYVELYGEKQHTAINLLGIYINIIGINYEVYPS